MYKNIIVLRAKRIGSLGRLKLELVYERPYGFGGQTKRCFVARTSLSQLPTSQHRHERPRCGMGVLLGAGFSSLKVANTVQLSLCFLGATVAFPCHHADSVAATLQLFPNQSAPWQSLSPVLKPGGSWGWGSDDPACRCKWCSAMLVHRLKVLPPPVECSAGRVGWGASQKVEGGKGARRKREKRGGWPLNSAVRKLWLSFQL